jgi:hypothetical protein
VITKHRECEGHNLRWAAEPEKINKYEENGGVERYKFIDISGVETAV